MKQHFSFKHPSYVLFTITTIFLFYYCKPPQQIQTFSAQTLAIDSLILPDSSMLQTITIYRQAIETEMNQILAYSEVHITKNQPEGLLNNFVADLILEMCNKFYAPEGKTYDVVLLNNGGLRAALPKGIITVGDVYRLMPFENEVVVVTLQPDKFLQMVQYIIESGGQPFAGMRIVTKQLQITELTIQGNPFDEKRNYTVITSDYLAAGGDKMNFFQNPVDYQPLGIKVRDVIIEYLKLQTRQNQVIHPKLDGRIKYE